MDITELQYLLKEDILKISSDIIYDVDKHEHFDLNLIYALSHSIILLKFSALVS